jgi:hypothetical protein
VAFANRNYSLISMINEAETPAHSGAVGKNTRLGVIMDWKRKE